MGKILNMKDDELKQQVIDALVSSKAKDPCKDVSRKLKMDQNFVRAIYNRNKVGQLRSQTTVVVANKKPELDFVSKEEIETEVVSSKRKKVSDDMKLEIMELLELRKYTYDQIAEKVGVSMSTVGRVAIELYPNKEDRPKGGNGLKRGRKPGSSKVVKPIEKGIEIPMENQADEIIGDEEIDKICYEKNMISSEEEQVVESKEISIQDTVFNTVLSAIEGVEPISKMNVVSTELISGRHMSAKYKTNLSIFTNPISDFVMYNFMAQEDIVRNFIVDNNVQKLVVYATGLQSPLCSVIKVCMEDNIPLDIMHWRSGTKEHLCQTIIPATEVVDSKFKCFSLLAENREVYTFGNIDTSVGSTLYSINCCKKIGDKNVSVASIFSTNPEWGLFGKLAEEINSMPAGLSIFMDKCKVESETYIFFDQNMAKSFNS